MIKPKFFMIYLRHLRSIVFNGTESLQKSVVIKKVRHYATVGTAFPRCW